MAPPAASRMAAGKFRINGAILLNYMLRRGFGGVTSKPVRVRHA